MKTLPIPESISEYLELNTDSPSGITWKKYVGGNSKVGKHAGCLSGGRYIIGFRGTSYFAYRIAYFLRNGEDLGERLADHGSNPTTSNSIRPATFSDNNACKPKTSRNKSGFKGVSWCSQTQKWRAQVAKDGKCICLGRFVNIEDAVLAYNAGAVEYHGDFAYLNPI